MPKRKRPEEKPEEQFKRFMETARQIGADDEQAEKAFAKLAPGKSGKKATAQRRSS